MRRLDKIIQNLIESAICDGLRRKPGDLVKRLSKEDREVLKEAKPKDFYHRLWK